MDTKIKKAIKRKAKTDTGNNKFRNVIYSMAVFVKRGRVQTTLILLTALAAAFFIIQNGAAPKTYRLEANERSPYNIVAPRDITNLAKAEKAASEAADAAEPVLKSNENAAFEAYRSIDDFFDKINSTRNKLNTYMEETELTPGSTAYRNELAVQQKLFTDGLKAGFDEYGIFLSDEQVSYLVARAAENELQAFRSVTIDLVGGLLKEQITEDNLSEKILTLQDEFQKRDLSQSLRNIGVVISRSVIKPSIEIDEEMTEARKKQVYAEEYEKSLENEKILKGERILSTGELVTEDIMGMLKELNLLENERRYDFTYEAGILILLLLGAAMLPMWLKMQGGTLKTLNKKQAAVTALIFMLVMLTARVAAEYFPPVAIPVFLAVMLTTILVNQSVAMILNLILTICIALMVRGDMQFMYMSVVAGTFTSVIMSKTYQRSRIALAGITCGLIAAATVASVGLIYREGAEAVLIDSAMAFINGIICAVIALGTLPFWETVFNIATPMRLLELVNPNHPLMKRLLLEAPGTYHHSIMVGNLAEMAIESIGGNTLLTRAGAYYHDIGKLKRPQFFKENQMAENPHDMISPRTSKEVITAHTADGVLLGKKHKLPVSVIDIIGQHHGTTTVSYFLHKAKKSGEDYPEEINSEEFRYKGPRPDTREAAAVMLADCVEAALRSMPSKTEDEVGVMVKKILKDRLDDGQLDKCDITLKDLNSIYEAFMSALGGYFHKRIAYPGLSEELMNEDDAGGSKGRQNTYGDNI